MPHDPQTGFAPSGRVLLVGAGPGPADLMTVRAQAALRSAEAVLYDALVDPEVLELAPRGCVKLQTGKRSGRACLSQAAINRLMATLAARGLQVVRLKGGDPSVFGRSGEEIAYLTARGIPVEVVAGVTAASAAAAQFAFPLTHRGEARRLVFATVRVADGGVVADGWAALADGSATLALYMARDSLARVCDALIAHGRPAATPALAVENAGRADARALRGDLRSLPDRLAEAALTGPVVVIVGATANQAWGEIEDVATAGPALCNTG